MWTLGPGTLFLFWFYSCLILLLTYSHACMLVRDLRGLCIDPRHFLFCSFQVLRRGWLTKWTWVIRLCGVWLKLWSLWKRTPQNPFGAFRLCMHEDVGAVNVECVLFLS